MVIKQINLKQEFAFLGENGADPIVKAYLPDNAIENEDLKRPCLVVCPGGGYSICSEREAEPIALDFLPENFNVFVLYYTCAPARFPTQIREVAAVMELIYKNADKWKCDTQKISIIGFSAGGHLAGHYSTMFDCKEVRAVFKDSKAPNGSILCYPVISAKEGKCHEGSFRSLVGHYPLSEEETNYFSLENCVSEKTPPTFLWHTASDDCVPVYSSLAFANALSEHNIPFELHVFPRGWHGLSTCDIKTVTGQTEECAYNRVWISEVIKWLKSMNLA